MNCDYWWLSDVIKRGILNKLYKEWDSQISKYEKQQNIIIKRNYHEIELKWTKSKEENKKLKDEGKKLGRGVEQYTKKGEFIKKYISLTEAERQTGVLNSSIVQCCKGKNKSAGGYVWKYVNTNN